MESFGVWMETRVHRGFYRLGVHIADRPWTYIIISLIASLALSMGVVRFHEVNNVRDHFSAENSPSRYEFAVAREFFREIGDPFHVIVALQAADGGSLLRPRHLEKALEIEDHLQYRLKVDHEDGGSYAYSDFCGAQCETTDTVSIFLTMFRNSRDRRKSSLKITFPTMDVYGHQVYQANNIFHVTVNESTREVESARLVVINFHAVYANASAERLMRRWERAVLDYAVATTRAPDQLIHVHATSEGLMSEEVRRTGEKATPLISVTFLVILSFTVVTSLRADPVKSKPLEAVVGVLCPLISLCASFGTLFWLNVEFLPIVIVVPFLILAVGVDDVFIVLHAWAQSDALALSLRDRIGHILADAGPSITITSLTNFLSFGIGVFTPTPAIRIFCTYTCVAVFFDYVYQIVFYTAVMVVFGWREERHLNAYAPWRRVAPDLGHARKPSAWRVRLAEWRANAVDAWVAFTRSGRARLALAALLAAYWTLAGYGVSQLRVGMSSEKLYLADSPLLALVHLQREVIFKDGGQMIIFVNNPGDLRDMERLKAVLWMLRRFENAPRAIGASSTQFWLSRYLSYISLQDGEFGFTYAGVPQFLNTSEFRQWRHYINVGTNQECAAEHAACVERFFFTTGFRDAVTWSDRLELLHGWRAIAAAFAPFNVTLFEHLSVYSDQLESIPMVTLQTVVCALICMTIVMVLFTPHYGTVLPGIACLLSINYGVFGLLYFCDIDLDPISMTTTLMAIGLSVDFIAHISFHYYKGDFENQRDRLRHALRSIGWPMVQAAASTVLSLLALAIIPAYMVQVFVKVITLVVSLGLLHGLVVLPVVFSAIPFRKSAPPLPAKPAIGEAKTRP